MKSSTAERLRQVPEGYLIVGVDPHKKRHAAVVMMQNAQVLAKRKFDNTLGGFEGLASWAEEQVRATGSRGVIFGIEAGGHYWRNLAYYLNGLDIGFRLVNPFTLKRRREGDDINRRKNDYRDAEMAGDLLRTGKFVDTRLPYGTWAELRATHSAYRRMVKESSRMRNTLKGLLDGLFPEFADIFKNPGGKTALAVLSLNVSPAAIAALEATAFVDLVRKRFNGRGLAVRKLREVHRLAGMSAGIREGAASVAREVSLLVQRLQLVVMQMEQQVIHLRQLVDAIPEGRPLLSIPGIGYITVAGLLAELGSLRGYQSSKQLVKMAGTNPTEEASAGKSGSHTPMSKKGRAGLRWVLWSAAANLIRINEDFRRWAKIRRERAAHAHPLHRREVIGAVCNRLLRLAYALVNHGECYRCPTAEVAI